MTCEVQGLMFACVGLLFCVTAEKLPKINEKMQERSK